MSKPRPLSFIWRGGNAMPSMSPMPSIPEPVKPVDAVELLARGIVNMTENKKSIYLMLVGEAGTGKTSVLALLMNVLGGRAPAEYNLEPYDTKNETGGTGFQSRTDSAKVYEFYSTNGVKITVLDTPGLADTRGLQKDKEHKDSIMAAIRDNIPEVTAVIILANGATRRPSVATDYAMTTLTSIFPRGLSSNICLLFTNVWSPLSFNFKTDTLPVELRRSRQFLLDNPLAMRKNFLAVDKKEQREILEYLERVVDTGHQSALNMLVKMFDWLDTLEPKTTGEIISLYDQSIEIERNLAETLPRMTGLPNKRKELQNLMSELDRYELALGSLDPAARKFHEESIQWALRNPITNLRGIVAATTREVENSTILIGRLVEQYAELSLSGSFSGQVKKSVNLLLEDIHNKSDSETIKLIEVNLEQLKEKLALLERAAFTTGKKIFS